MEYLSADPGDKAYFKALNEACYRDVISRQFGSWDTELQSDNFDAKWQQQDFKKILVDGKVVGGVWLEELADVFQLREIQIHPDYQGHGIGTKVVQDAIDMAQTSEKGLMLRVLFENRAVNLYKKLGFVEVDKNSTQYVMAYHTKNNN